MPELDLRWRVLRRILGTPYLCALHLRVSGLERIPEEGAAILAVNHVSVLDPVGIALVAYARGRAIRFLAAAEFFDHLLAGPVLRGWDQIPIKRGARDVAALDELVGALGQGRLAGIFPEGRVADGRTRRRGGTGVARVARATGAPVIPVGIWGTQARMPRGHIRWSLPLRTPVAVAVGEPISVDPSTSGAQELRAATNRIMGSIEALTEKARLATEHWLLPRKGSSA